MDLNLLPKLFIVDPITAMKTMCGVLQGMVDFGEMEDGSKMTHENVMMTLQKAAKCMEELFESMQEGKDLISKAK